MNNHQNFSNSTSPCPHCQQPVPPLYIINNPTYYIQYGNGETPIPPQPTQRPSQQETTQSSAVTDGLLNTLSNMEQTFGMSALNSVLQQQQQRQQRQNSNSTNSNTAPLNSGNNHSSSSEGGRRRRMFFRPPTRGIGPISAFANSPTGQFPFFNLDQGGEENVVEYEFSAVIPIVVNEQGEMVFDSSDWDTDQGIHPCLTDEEINEIPTFPYTTEGDAEGANYCIVCQNLIEAGALVKQLSCSHVFHNDCVSSWLKYSNTCPLCRTIIKRNEEKGEEDDSDDIPEPPSP